MSIALFKSKLIRSSAGASTFLLVVPLAANYFWEEFNWRAGDFLIAWMLIFPALLAFRLVTRPIKASTQRIAWGITIGTLFLLIWSNLAVGLIGNEENPANLLYLLVLVVGVAGAVRVRFSSEGMRWVLLCMAGLQFLIPFLALLLFRPNLELPEYLNGLAGIVAINALYSFLFVLSAALFRASQQQAA